MHSTSHTSACLKGTHQTLRVNIYFLFALYLFEYFYNEHINIYNQKLNTRLKLKKTVSHLRTRCSNVSKGRNDANKPTVNTDVNKFKFMKI